jgi:hypothetical protein
MPPPRRDHATARIAGPSRTRGGRPHSVTPRHTAHAHRRRGLEDGLGAGGVGGGEAAGHDVRGARDGLHEPGLAAASRDDRVTAALTLKLILAVPCEGGS